MHVERWSYIEFRSNYVLDQTGENNYYKFLSRNVVKVKKKIKTPSKNKLTQ